MTFPLSTELVSQYDIHGVEAGRITCLANGREVFQSFMAFWEFPDSGMNLDSIVIWLSVSRTELDENV